MEFQNYPIQEFLQALASKAPAPGGGGASALTAALGAALGSMVGNLTVGKAAYREQEADLYCLMRETEQIQEELTALIQKDADAFTPLSQAYRMDKTAPEYDRVMEQALRRAAQPPMEILRLSCRMIELQREYAEKGSKLAVSDAGTGAVLCWAAMYGAALNVLANTRLMKDRLYAEKLNDEVGQLMQRYWPVAEQTYDRVYQKLKQVSGE